MQPAFLFGGSRRMAPQRSRFHAGDRVGRVTTAAHEDQGRVRTGATGGKIVMTNLYASAYHAGDCIRGRFPIGLALFSN
jgi:hypothetical protein